MAASLGLVDYSSDESDHEEVDETEPKHDKTSDQNENLHLVPLKEGENVLSLHKKMQLNSAPLVEPSHTLEVRV